MGLNGFGTVGRRPVSYRPDHFLVYSDKKIALINNQILLTLHLCIDIFNYIKFWQRKKG